jgi:hypothetical protein
MHPIKETLNYILSVGEENGKGSLCYQVTHKVYGVVEIQTFLLPQALKHLNDLEAALSAQQDIDSTFLSK